MPARTRRSQACRRLSHFESLVSIRPPLLNCLCREERPHTRLPGAVCAKLGRMNLGKPGHRPTLTAVGFGLFILAAALLFTAVRPSPALNLDNHWQVFGKYAGLAALLLVGASLLAAKRYRIGVALASVLILSVAALEHPVCVLIPEADRPAFETVVPLQERAARGEPFCRFGGEWYQCKSFISRAFFF